VREACGISHDRQILRIPRIGGQSGGLKNAETGEPVPFQYSLMDPDSGFAELSLGAFQPLTIVETETPGASEDPDPGDVTCRITEEGIARISNGMFSLEVSVGEDRAGSETGWESGPILRFRIGEGPWRGRTFFDLQGRVQSFSGEMLEDGPLRSVYRYAAKLAPGGFYTAIITVDRSQPFAVVEEDFRAGSGDQVVWDFSEKDLPGEFYLLDSSAAYQVRPLFYHFDQRVSRMMCWTQQSQHFGFSDGYAIGFGSGEQREIAGFVALEGGEWRGGKLNHLEAWTRRWFPGDPASRRNVPFEAKADGQAGPESTRGRGAGLCEPHFNVEGWIGQGRRKWALVLSTLDRIRPSSDGGKPLGHFENSPTRERYRQQQSLLRKIHTQYGILPLRDFVERDFAWEEEPLSKSAFQYPNETLDRHFPVLVPPEEAKREMMAFLAARVFGFWEGSGSAYTNPVVSRPAAPEMFRYEWLVRQGVFNDEERRQVRAHFAFLMHLFASENYYTGDASMLPMSSPDSLDPTLAGMANQNFYTDVITVFGTGAQIFWKHPLADRWRERFLERWRRQLECHMYPESGVWEESHTYYHHVLHTVLPLFLRRRADEAGDEFANPDLQRLVGAEISQLTPRDAFFDDSRHVVIFGDHGVDVARYRYLWRALAEAFLPHNPALAGNLAWAYREMRGGSPMQVSAAAPPVRNEYVQGLGVMFRGIDARGGECLLALRSGAAWGHHHNDDGSLQFYAGGRALVVDAAFSLPSAGKNKFEAAGHSRWTLKSQEPVNYLWRFNRGWVTDSSLAGPLSYAVAYSPVFLARAGGEPGLPLHRPVIHFRTVVQLAPSAYLVVDVSDSNDEQIVFFHLPGAVEQQGRRVSASHATGALYLYPLSSGEMSLRMENQPSKPADGDRYSTVSVGFETGRRAMSVFLITWARGEETLPQVSQSEDRWVIRGEQISADLLVEKDRWSVLDRVSGMERSFPSLPTF
jgi:hypothetical protein